MTSSPAFPAAHEFHMSLRVADLERSTVFYTAFVACHPSKPARMAKKHRNPAIAGRKNMRPEVDVMLIFQHSRRPCGRPTERTHEFSDVARSRQQR
ncbi:hypothetical protein [Acidithiobacillus thiooxidans]|uniref:hypothetical protein n=2 Tax=Acidithiobacillus thiooxidans TaxID=930 RepID=UPI001930B8E6|nr:hypothetical protein [Acidithiobacillus thiooxidans]